MSCGSGCSTVGDMMKRIAIQLRDYEEGYKFVRWHPDTLADYIKEALCEISQHRPDAFAKTVTLTLKPGATQSLPPEYDRLISIKGNATVNPDGTVNVTTDVRKEASSEWRDIYRRAACQPSCEEGGVCDVSTSVTNIISYTPDIIDDTMFSVYPPIPPGSSGTVLASVITRPANICATNPDMCLGLACKYEAQVMDWALHRAYGADHESNFNRTAADRHLKAFYDALGIKRLSESLFNQEVQEGEPVPASHPQRRLATTNR